MEIRDMPKLKSPFVRKEINKKYIVTPEIEEGYEWVFESDDVMAVEKFDGTNVSIIIENGRITRIFNRTAEVPFFNKGKSFIIEGVIHAFERGYCDLTDGQYFGEVIGPKLAGNPYNLDRHIWLPFNTYGRKHCSYNSWGKYPKDFETISRWFKEDIFSLYMRKKGIVMPPEGIVFHNLKTGEMAKLRIDMFDWYDGKPHKWSEVKRDG